MNQQPNIQGTAGLFFKQSLRAVHTMQSLSEEADL